MIRIVPAAAVGGAARLESLLLAVFGAGDRPSGWFSTKLRAGHVDDALSQVAVDDAIDPRSPRAWRGFVLVGTPPSRAPAVRTAGTGVVEGARRQGLGGRLLDAAAAAAAARAAQGLELVAHPDRETFYLAHGFQRRATWTTLAITTVPDATGPDANAIGTASAAREPDDDGRPPLAGTSPEAWAAADARRTHDGATLGRVQLARVSAYTDTWLVHRWSPPADVPLSLALASLRTVLAPGATLLLPQVATRDVAALEAVSSITDRDRATALRIVERALLLHRPLPRDAPS